MVGIISMLAEPTLLLYYLESAEEKSMIKLFYTNEKTVSVLPRKELSLDRSPLKEKRQLGTYFTLWH